LAFISSTPGLAKLNQDIFTGIALAIPVISFGGVGVALELADKRRSCSRYVRIIVIDMRDAVAIPAETAASVVDTLTAILRSASSSRVARTTSIELLSKLHEKHGEHLPYIIGLTSIDSGI
jgi:hypothetical protein